MPGYQENSRSPDQQPNNFNDLPFGDYYSPFWECVSSLPYIETAQIHTRLNNLKRLIYTQGSQEIGIISVLNKHVRCWFPTPQSIHEAESLYRLLFNQEPPTTGSLPNTFSTNKQKAIIDKSLVLTPRWDRQTRRSNRSLEEATGSHQKTLQAAIDLITNNGHIPLTLHSYSIASFNHIFGQTSNPTNIQMVQFVTGIAVYQADMGSGKILSQPSNGPGMSEYDRHAISNILEAEAALNNQVYLLPPEYRGLLTS